MSDDKVKESAPEKSAPEEKSSKEMTFDEYEADYLKRMEKKYS
jgi:hypothetical protein